MKPPTMNFHNLSKLLLIFVCFMNQQVLGQSLVQSLGNFGTKPRSSYCLAQNLSNTLMNGGSLEDLQPVNGMHLTPGLNRSAKAAIEPYNPGEPMINMKWVRWLKNSMPIAIWISPGLMLPNVPFDEIPNTRCDLVYQMIKADPKNPFATLSKAPNWTESTNEQVANGIEQWREFEKEGLFQFGFTDNPADAQVLIFFTDIFKDASGPGGVAAGGITTAKIFPQDKLHLVHKMPVIIELSTVVNCEPEKMQASSAHEFGHALGIKAHSPYREDLMYVDRVVNNLSPADKATIRSLYHANTDYVMY